MKKRVTVSEAVDMLVDIEHKRLSESALRACLKTHGVKIGKDHKLSVTALLKARKSSKANSTGGTGSDEIRAARLRKVNLECRRLTVEVEKIERKQEQERMRNLRAWVDTTFGACRSRLDATMQHEIAKRPESLEQITAYFDRTLEIIVETMEEARGDFPEPDM